MKFTKIILLLALMILVSVPASCEVLTGEVSFDWTFFNQEQRDKTVKYYHDILFDNVKNKIDTSQFLPYKKDNDSQTTRYLIKNNMLKQPDRTLAGFYMFNKILIIYGIKYENNKKNIFYYDALGKLIYVDIFDKNYDEYPNKAFQYRKNGTLAGVTYYISEDDQYSYKADGEFYCRWYEDKCYDKKAKKVITRKFID